MEELTELIGRICTRLEEANADRDWEMVDGTIEELNLLYEDLEKRTSSYGYEY